ncbi:MAG: hypothetical protein NVS2B12_03040 [Ktedonobacteraceae bacterium]
MGCPLRQYISLRWYTAELTEEASWHLTLAHCMPARLRLPSLFALSEWNEL